MVTPKSNPPAEFAAFILTNGRPDRVFTYETLRRNGYTGRVVLVVDNEDKTRQQYAEKYGDEVEVFDKLAIARTFDQGDNFGDRRAIIYARNASFEIARKLGIRYFIQLDDDYTNFSFRFDERLDYLPRTIRDLNKIFEIMVRFYQRSGVHSVAMAQGGDFVGGPNGSNPYAKRVHALRKCMNSFVCSTDRPFKFVGRINEDVNTYAHLASKGLLLLTTNQISLGQKQTQTNAGGMTELYLDSGTYVKSFYSVMYQPSSVRIRVLYGQQNSRLHHSVSWRNTVPKILRESLRKART